MRKGQPANIYHMQTSFTPFLAIGPLGTWEMVIGTVVLVAIGITFSPFRVAYDLITTPELLTSATWMPFLSSGQHGLFRSQV